MRVVAWITEGTWAACVDATTAHAPEDADVVLLHVVDEEVASAAHGSFAGLLGRGRPERDPGPVAEEQLALAGEALLRKAAERFGRPCATEVRRGHVEHEVVEAAEGADLLVVARDGDRTRLGPRSIGHPARFVVDHAPCAVLLVWPGTPPTTETMPHPPDQPPRHRPPHH